MLNEHKTFSLTKSPHIKHFECNITMGSYLWHLLTYWNGIQNGV